MMNAIRGETTDRLLSRKLLLQTAESFALTPHIYNQKLKSFSFSHESEEAESFQLERKVITCRIPYFNSISKKLYSTAWAGRWGT